MFRTVVLLCALALLACAVRFEEVPEAVRKLSGEELVAHVNKQGKWKAELYSRFEGLSTEELRSHLGALKKPAHVRRRGQLAKPLSKAQKDAIPDSFNSLDKWPECKDVIGQIQDQSACGSCWAVSTASVMSDRLCIASQAKIQTSISSLDIMSCCRFCGYQCQGGWPDQAFYHFIDNGVVTGSNYTDNALCKPYPIPPCVQDPETKKHTCPDEPTHDYACEKKCKSGYTAESYANDHYYGQELTYFSNQNDEAIDDLLKNGPIVAAFDVYRDFYSYKTGIYEYTAGEYLGGHAVRVVGYGTENGVPYWKVANSWHDYWGEEGYFRIRRNTNECNFEEEIVSATADVKRSLKGK